MDYNKKIIEAIELHSEEGIQTCFENGVGPNDLLNDRPLLYELTGEYTRSPRFKDCVQVFVDFGLRLEDKALLNVLLDDAIALETQLLENPDIIAKKYTLRCAYTPIFEASLLHICAEYNHVACAEVLLRSGIDKDATAGYDENGFGGQTPIFHTVNQNSNQSFDMLQLLLSHAADLEITVPGLIWGNGYDWETFIPAVNPLSYAMMGLLPQMHRSERTISEVVGLLVKHRYGISYKPKNVPCKYLE
jgi:hypothetical protein